jgi:hypothetical protein
VINGLLLLLKGDVKNIGIEKVVDNYSARECYWRSEK